MTTEQKKSELKNYSLALIIGFGFMYLFFHLISWAKAFDFL